MKQLKRGIIIILFFLSKAVFSQEKIDILHADALRFDDTYIDAQRLTGNVRFQQGNTFLNCDSAWFWNKTNIVEAFGRIYIKQADTFNLYGDYLHYNGNTKIATVSKNVRLFDNTMNLTTDAIQYDLSNKIGYYTVGGIIHNAENQLSSRVGRYYSRSKTFFFKDKVKLVNPQYTINCDTLQYNTISKIAWFYGPTYIKSEDNLLFANYGWYNTKNNTCQFNKRAYIKSKENKIESDSFLYNRNTGIGRAFGNIKLTDSIQEVTIYGKSGLHNRFNKSTLITGNPFAQKLMENDTLLLKADTFFDAYDTLKAYRNLSAFGKAKFYKNDIQGICDSMCFSFSDSTIRLFKDPILWNENSQITGDTMYIHQKNQALDKLEVLHNTMMIMMIDSTKYNQIKGQYLDAFFKNNQVYLVKVLGNGQSLYYAQEDSNTYMGVNYIECYKMNIFTENNSVKTIKFYEKPIGTFYPISQLPADKLKLENFKYPAAVKPEKSEFKVPKSLNFVTKTNASNPEKTKNQAKPKPKNKPKRKQSN